MIQIRTRRAKTPHLQLSPRCVVSQLLECTNNSYPLFHGAFPHSPAFVSLLSILGFHSHLTEIVCFAPFSYFISVYPTPCILL